MADGDGSEETEGKAAKPRTRKPAPPNPDMAWLLARLLVGGEVRRHAGVGMPPWWAVHVPDGLPRRLDDRTVSGLQDRGHLAQDEGRSAAVRASVLVLSEEGSAAASALPPPDPAYRTPHERRQDKRADVWRSKGEAWAKRQG